MSTARRQTFGELRSTFTLMRENSRSPISQLEKLEEAITDAELTTLLEPYQNDEAIPDTFFPRVREFLRLRWLRISEFTFMQYQHNTQSCANRICIALADLSQLALNQNLIQLLIPEIESAVDIIFSD